MFTKCNFFKKLTSMLLCAGLTLSLSGCNHLPAELIGTLHQATHQLDELAVQLSSGLDAFLDVLYAQQGTNAPEIPAGSSFAVHYIDVGQADCALVSCDGSYMLIDGGNAEDSDLVYSYLKNKGVEHLEYIVATHPHEDHIGGLSGAVYAANVGTALSPTAQSDSEYFSNLTRALARQGKSITVPDPGDTFSLGSASVEILGPLKEYDDLNDLSLVLRVEYGSTVFLFTGDMESPAETDLVEAGVDLSATVLKVGHHGSSSSTSYRFLREVMPEYAVISVGKGNRYGHPTETVLSRLEDAGTTIYRTDLQGTILVESDGSSVTFRPETGDSTLTPDAPYIGNSNSKKFHTAACSSTDAINAQYKVSFDSRESAVSSGYTPCGRCNP